MAIYSRFTHWRWCFSIAMLVYQRVPPPSEHLSLFNDLCYLCGKPYAINAINHTPFTQFHHFMVVFNKPHRPKKGIANLFFYPNTKHDLKSKIQIQGPKTTPIPFAYPINGGFRKYGYPQIKSSISIGFSIINIYKPSIWGYLHLWKPHETSKYPSINHKTNNGSPCRIPLAQRLSQGTEIVARLEGFHQIQLPAFTRARPETGSGRVSGHQTWCQGISSTQNVCVCLNGKNHDSHGEKVSRFRVFPWFEATTCHPKKGKQSYNPPLS